jgi:hypothetical protein
MTSRPERFVVVKFDRLRDGTTLVSYLSRRGKSLDAEKRATGQRDWVPFLDSNVEYFSDLGDDTAAVRAAQACETYGGSVLAYSVAVRIEQGNTQAWSILQPSDLAHEL